MESRRSSRRVPPVALAVGSLAMVAVGGAVAWTQLRGDDDPVAAILDQPAGPDVLAENPPEAPHDGEGAPSPEEAVTRFLAAEVADDWEASFELLSLDDRNRYLTAGTWSTRRDDVLGSIEDWDWTSKDDLATELAIAPLISLTQGIKTPAAEARWGVVDEGGWRISLADSSLVPLLPPDAEALEVAQRWLDTDCATVTATTDPGTGPDADSRSGPGPFRASDPTLAAEACTSGALADDAEPTEPSGRAAAELQVAFGPSGTLATRTVALATPADTSLVLVPHEGGWAVLDVLRHL